jgi:endonuclease
MREDFRTWLKSEGYADNTCNAQIARVQRIEAEYGPIEDIVNANQYDLLFRALTYSTADERHQRPNPSKFKIDGNLRNNLASYKDALARYRRFLSSPITAKPLIDAPLPSFSNSQYETVALPELVTMEKQRISLERDMQNALRQQIAQLDPHLTIIDDGAERAVDSGFIDILARDSRDAIVVIELKAGKTDNRVIGQILGYMGDIAVEYDGTAVRGIIVAHEFDQRTRSAARAVPNLTLVRYAMSFTFETEA